jgi:hypothetical protein
MNVKCIQQRRGICRILRWYWRFCSHIVADDL